jgi:sarcosine oxidase subunit gamma
VTSVAWSNTLLKTIGLAMVNPSLTPVGTRLVFRLSDGTTVDGKVCATPFYDPDGKRQKQTVTPQRSFSFLPETVAPLASAAAVNMHAIDEQHGETSHTPIDTTHLPIATFEDRNQRKRIGLKGPRAAAWLQERGISIPERANSWTAITASENDVVMRLGSSEFFFEQSVHASEFESLASGLKGRLAGVYPVLREDRAFMLSGAAADAVLAQVCNVNFDSLALHERHAVMTMMIGVAVTVVPQGNVAHRRYLIWCDPSFGDYLSATLRSVVADIQISGEGS